MNPLLGKVPHVEDKKTAWILVLLAILTFFIPFGLVIAGHAAILARALEACQQKVQHYETGEVQESED